MDTTSASAVSIMMPPGMPPVAPSSQTPTAASAATLQGRQVQVWTLSDFIQVAGIAATAISGFYSLGTGNYIYTGIFFCCTILQAGGYGMVRLYGDLARINSALRRTIGAFQQMVTQQGEQIELAERRIGALTVVNQEVNAENQALTSQVRELREVIDRLERAVADLTKSNVEAKAANDRMAAAIDAFQEILTSFTGEISSAAVASSSVVIQVGSLDKTTTVLREERTRMEVILSGIDGGLQSNLREMAHQLTEAKAQFVTICAGFATERELFERHLQTLVEQVDAFEAVGGSLSEKVAQLSSLRSQIEEGDLRYAALQTQYTALSSRMEKLQEQLCKKIAAFKEETKVVRVDAVYADAVARDLSSISRRFDSWHELVVRIEGDNEEIARQIAALAALSNIEFGEEE